MAKEEQKNFEFKDELEFVDASLVLCLVDKIRFNRLPSRVQAYSVKATSELIRGVGLVLNESENAVYIFKSESNFYRGVNTIRETPRYKRREFACISVAPLLLLNEIVSLRPRSVHIDFGCERAMDIDVSKAQELIHLSVLVRIARLSSIYVVETRRGHGVSMDIEGKKCALGFFDKNAAESALGGLEADFPGCAIRANKPRVLAQNIIKSELDGVVFDATMPSQMILYAQDLEKLNLVFKTLKLKKSWIEGILK